MPTEAEYERAAEGLQELLFRADQGDTLSRQLVMMACAGPDLRVAIEPLLSLARHDERKLGDGGAEGVLQTILRQDIAAAELALAKAGALPVVPVENASRIERNRELLRDAGLPDGEVERYCGVAL